MLFVNICKPIVARHATKTIHANPLQAFARMFSNFVEELKADAQFIAQAFVQPAQLRVNNA